MEKHCSKYRYTDETAILKAEAELALGMADQAKSSIEQGIPYNSSNYELYFMLGEAYEKQGSYECAYLCYEYSVFLCGEREDRKLLQENFECFRDAGKELPRGLSIVIQSGGNLDLLKLSIRFVKVYNPPESYSLQVIVTENFGPISRWLEGEGIAYFSDEKAMGNLGQETDILLLEGNALPLEHAVFNLRLALYQDEQTAMAGSISQPEQEFSYSDKAANDIEKCMEYAHHYNVPGMQFLEQTVLLRGSMIIIKGNYIEQIGWIDSEFAHKSWGIMDLGFRMIENGKSLVTCHNSLVISAGQNVAARDTAGDARNFLKKWKFNPNYSCFARKELIQMMGTRTDSHFRILEVGCACGATLLLAKQRFPGCSLYGIELEEGPARIAGSFAEVTQANIEESLDYPPEFFTYIIIGDVLEHLRDPWTALKKLRGLLTKDGKIIASIPNVMHISVVKSLLQGNWSYQDAGILDRTHLRFFTAKEVTKMMADTGYHITQMGRTAVPISEEDKKLIDNLARLGGAEKDMYRAYQYLVAAEKA